jgi:hypothetical protein
MGIKSRFQGKVTDLYAAWTFVLPTLPSAVWRNMVQCYAGAKDSCISGEPAGSRGSDAFCEARV